MGKVVEGDIRADGLKFAVIVGRFNSFITEKLVDGARDALLRHGAKDDDLTLIRVPGAFEIPGMPTEESRLPRLPRVLLVLCLCAFV